MTQNIGTGNHTIMRQHNFTIMKSLHNLFGMADFLREKFCLFSIWLYRFPEQSGVGNQVETNRLEKAL